MKKSLTKKEQLLVGLTLFSMFFICFAGYLYGAKVGIFTGIAYGLLQFLQDPYLYSVGQFFLDYPLAFASLGMAGFCKNQKFEILRLYTKPQILLSYRFVQAID